MTCILKCYFITNIIHMKMLLRVIFGTTDGDQRSKQLINHPNPNNEIAAEKERLMKEIRSKESQRKRGLPPGFMQKVEDFCKVFWRLHKWQQYCPQGIFMASWSYTPKAHHWWWNRCYLIGRLRFRNIHGEWWTGWTWKMVLALKFVCDIWEA